MAPLDEGLGGALEVSDLTVAAAAAQFRQQLISIKGARHVVCMHSCGRGVSGACVGINNRMSCCTAAVFAAPAARPHASMPAHPAHFLAGHAYSTAHLAPIH
jgi:hypothetical protein